MGLLNWSGRTISGLLGDQPFHPLWPRQKAMRAPASQPSGAGFMPQASFRNAADPRSAAPQPTPLTTLVGRQARNAPRIPTFNTGANNDASQSTPVRRKAVKPTSNIIHRPETRPKPGTLKDLVPGLQWPPLGSEELGFIAQEQESSGGKVTTPGNTKGDPGKGGYGPWQLSATWGMPAFLKSQWGKSFAPSFGNLRPGTEKFDDQYRTVEARNPAELRQAQHDYVEHELYRPVADFARANGFDLDSQGIREAVWSIAVQHGKAKDILRNVIAMGRQRGDPNDVIAEIYKQRMNYVGGLKSLPLDRKRNELDRYIKESRHNLKHEALVRAQKILRQCLVDSSNEK